MALYIGDRLKTRDSELVAYLRSEDVNEETVSLETDSSGKLRVYFYFDKEKSSKMAEDFEAGVALGNIFEYIKCYKEVIKYVIGIMGTGSPS